MTAPAALAAVADALPELAPVARRAVSLDAQAVARIVGGDSRVALYVRLPFGVLVSRTVAAGGGDAIDVVVAVTDLLAWLDGEREAEPARCDERWRSGLPPRQGWHRVDAVPDGVVRDLVRTGALTLKELGVRGGVPGAQPRAEVADALLDSSVLTVSDDSGHRAEVSLRALSSLTRMGFLPRGSHVVVAVSGRWVRIAAEYGSVYVERAGLTLGVLR